MAALGILLDELSGAPWPQPTTPSEPYVLTLDHDIVIGLVENDATGHIDLFSSPGYLHAGRLRNDELSATSWFYDYQENVDEVCITRSIRVDRDTGLILFVESWPRSALNLVRFQKCLVSWVELIRCWRRIVYAEPQ